MPYCPECKNRFEGVTECPTHGIALVDELPFQAIDGPSSTWVEIESVGTEEEARIVSGFLEGEGIPCQVESLRVDAAPVNLGTMSEIRIYVSAENEKMALDLLAQRQREYGALRDDASVVTDEGPAVIEENTETVVESEE